MPNPSSRLIPSVLASLWFWLSASPACFAQTASVYAGGGSTFADNVPATSSGLGSPSGLTIDASGNLYIADELQNRIRKVSTAGIITTVAGNGSSARSGDNGNAIYAGLGHPNSLAFDASGNLFVTETGSCTVRKITPAGIITTVAGTGACGFGGDGGQAIYAQLNIPRGIAVDAGGNLLFADSANRRIRKISKTGIITTIAGTGTGGYSGDGGLATLAELSVPNGVTIGPDGRLYIADTGNSTIRAIDASGIIQTIVGTGVTAAGPNGDGGYARNADAGAPIAMAFDGQKNLFFTQALADEVRRVDPNGVISTFTNGTGIFQAMGIAVDASGKLYVGDSYRVLAISRDPFVGSPPSAPTIGGVDYDMYMGHAVGSVSFSPPASNGGTPITGYTVSSNPVGGVDLGGGSTLTTHLISGLIAGQTYTFVVHATNAAGASPPSTASAPYTHFNPPDFTVADASFVEGNDGARAGKFVVTLSHPAPRPVSFTYSTSDLSATAGQDYATASAIEATIPAGQSKLEIPIAIMGDTVAESNEQFKISFSAISNAIAARTVATGTILDDDSSPYSLSVSDQTFTEGNSGQRTVNVTITLSAPATASGVSFTVDTSSATATEGVDYFASRTNYTLAAGDSSVQFPITLVGDTVYEPNETFNVDLSDVVGATVSNGRAEITITNDDPSPKAEIYFSETGIAYESDNNNNTKSISFMLANAVANDVSFDVSTSDGTAVANQDYVPVNHQHVAIPAGQLDASIAVGIIGDYQVEPKEVFYVSLSNISNATAANTKQTVTIWDNDNGDPGITVADIRVPEGNSGMSNAVFKLTLSRALSSDTKLQVSTTDDSARSEVNYGQTPDFVARSYIPVFIPAGSVSADFPVTIYGDKNYEPDEDFTIHVSSLTTGVKANVVAKCTIVNDDPNPPATVADAYVVLVNKALSVTAVSGVLANDSSPGGEPLTASVASPPSRGSLAFNPDGSFTYTPAASTYGTDTFTYKACTPGGNCGTGSVNLDVTRGVAVVPTDRYLWMVPPGENAAQQGFIRITNPTANNAIVQLWGLDQTGAFSSGIVTFELKPWHSLQLNSQDLEFGNPGKPFSGTLGSGSGNWSIVVHASSAVDALAYIRTPDGFLTSMHDTSAGDGVDWRVPIFNPAENANQASRLRLVNTSQYPADVLISGIDDAGTTRGSATIQLAPRATVELTSSDLESGNTSKHLVGSLGDGVGKWQLRVSSTQSIAVQSLLFDPNGYLTNLSSLPDLHEPHPGEKVLWFVPSASNTQQQGFIRITNRESRASEVAIWGVDDTGHRSSGTLFFQLASNESRQFNSGDLEFGNASKASGALGTGTGNWQLHVLSDLDLWPEALIRTPDGFLTSVHDSLDAPSPSLYKRVPMVNPGGNANQVSSLRLVNPNSSSTIVTLRAVDDAGNSAPGGMVSLTLAGNTAIELSSLDLELGNADKGLIGALGAGVGKWYVGIKATQPVKILSLLRDPKGYLTNLSSDPNWASGALME